MEETCLLIFLPVFELVSAYGTVGLSLGLPFVSRRILIIGVCFSFQLGQVLILY